MLDAHQDQTFSMQNLQEFRYRRYVRKLLGGLPAFESYSLKAIPNHEIGSASPGAIPDPIGPASQAIPNLNSLYSQQRFSKLSFANEYLPNWPLLE